jgi:serine/threonine-protein kinase
VLFTIAGRGGEWHVAVLDLRTGQWRTVISEGTQARYVATGHVVFVQGGALWAVAFDVAALDVVGDPIPVLESVNRTGTDGRGLATVANLAISSQGTLVYAPVEGGGTRSLVWVDRRGAEEPISAPERRYFQPRLSPDDGRVAVTTPGSRGIEAWIWDFALRRLTPLQFGQFGANGTFSIWSHDAQSLIFNALTDGGSDLVRWPVDGTGAGEPFTTGSAGGGRPLDISPDGRLLVFERSVMRSFDLMLLDLDATSNGPRAASPLVATPADERNGSIAPDGRWIAYDSNKSGRSEIYVRPFPNARDAEHPITTDGGRTPVWSPAGGELFFVSGQALMAATVQTKPAFSVGNPTRLFDAQSRILDGRLLGNTGRTFDVSRDGQRFLMLKDTADAADSALPSIVVVQNWFEELLARVPVR